MPKRVTIKDIARELNLSYQSVSACLSQTRGTARVSEETARLIRETAARMNYRIDQGARSLRHQRITQIAVVVEKLGQRHGPAVKMASIIALEEHLSRRGYSLQIIQDDFDRWDRVSTPRYLEVVSHAGFVLYSTSPQVDEAMIALFRRYQIPWVVLNGRPHWPNTLAIDDASATRRLTRHLISLGHRRILYLGYTTDHHSDAERRRGYDEEMGVADLPRLHLSWSLDPSSNEDRQTKYLELDDPAIRRQLVEFVRLELPTAIVCYNDIFAWTTNQILQEAGFAVPADISITGASDLPHSNHCAPALTTARQHHYDLGRLAALAILDALKNPTGNVVHAPLTPDLIIRRSTAKPRDA